MGREYGKQAGNWDGFCGFCFLGVFSPLPHFEAQLLLLTHSLPCLSSTDTVTWFGLLFLWLFWVRGSVLLDYNTLLWEKCLSFLNRHLSCLWSRSKLLFRSKWGFKQQSFCAFKADSFEFYVSNYLTRVVSVLPLPAEFAVLFCCIRLVWRQMVTEIRLNADPLFWARAHGTALHGNYSEFASNAGERGR